MPLNGPGLATEIETVLAPFSGPQLPLFSSILGNGIVNGSTGIITFVTADVGTVPGTGAGIGAGILGLVDANISSVMFSTGQGFWSPSQPSGPGAEWQGFCDKISLAVKDHFSANATLTSTHSPVFVGSGTVQSYSGVTAASLKSAITALAPTSWNAARFPELADAVATGVVTEILGHAPASTVAITGSPSGTPVPGTGSGSGVVT